MTYYCGECGKECTAHVEDDGIGPYEFWGRQCNQSIKVLASDCCDGSVFNDEELEEEADAGEYQYEEECERGDWLYEQAKDRKLEERYECS